VESPPRAAVLMRNVKLDQRSHEVAQSVSVPPSVSSGLFVLSFRKEEKNIETDQIRLGHRCAPHLKRSMCLY